MKTQYIFMRLKRHNNTIKIDFMPVLFTVQAFSSSFYKGCDSQSG